MVPFGEEENKRTLGKAQISNIGLKGDNTANYECVFEDDTETDQEPCKVKSFERDKGFWSLIGEALIEKENL